MIKLTLFLSFSTFVILILNTLKQKKMSEKLDQIQELISGINDSTNNIAADLERIAGGLTGGLSAEEADSVIAQLQTSAEQLKAVAATTPEPATDPVDPIDPVDPVDPIDPVDPDA